MTDYFRFDIDEGENLKTFDLYHNNIVIKDKKKNVKIIDLSNMDIFPVKDSETEIKLIYNSNGEKQEFLFTSKDRGNLLSRVLKTKDSSSKIISDYSIETFKCYNLSNIEEQPLKEIGELLNENYKSKSSKILLKSQIDDFKKYISFLTLYRSYSVINKLYDKEWKYYYIEISRIIKIKIFENIYGLIFEDINKIQMAIIPINQQDISIIKNLIITYSSKYLGSEIKYEENESYFSELSLPDLSLKKGKSNIYKSVKLDKKEAGHNFNLKKKNPLKTSKNLALSPIKNSYNELKNRDLKLEEKSEIYLYTYNNVYRILYNGDKQKTTLKLSSEYIVIHPNNSNPIKYPLSNIFIIALKGEKEDEEEYFEIIIKDSRFIFQLENKNIFLNNLIELLLKYYNMKKIKEKLILISYKIGVKKYMRNVEDASTRLNLEERKIEEIKYEKEDFLEILEDIVFNYYFAEEISDQNNIDSLLKEPITKKLIQNFDDCYNKCINGDKKDIKKNVILLNLYLIFFKNLGTYLITNDNGKKICESVFEKMTKELIEKNSTNKKNEKIIILNDYALFFNAIHIFEHLQLYKQIILLRIMSFNIDAKLNEFDYESMHINLLLVLFENKLKNSIEIPDDMLPESICYYFLSTIYKILLYGPLNILKKAISFLSTFMEKTTKEKQREIKDILLKKTLIFYAVIRIYFVNDNNDFLLTKLCLRLFQILLNQYYEITIPIKNIFPSTLIKNLGAKKDPDKWDKSESEIFFIDILKNYNDDKIIWNKECKDELIKALKELIQEYEESVKFKLIDMNPSYNETKEKNFKTLLNIVFNPDISDNYKMNPKKSMEYKPLYSIDYLNYKVNYNTLKKEVYILDTYIGKLVENNIDKIKIQKPQKFWKKLIKASVNNSDEKRLVIIKALKLIYKDYFKDIGNFGFYNIMNRLYKSTNNKKIQEQIKQLFYVSINIEDDEIKEDNIHDMKQEEINYINV